MLTIRKAGIQDLRAITEIYNEAVLHTTATFDTGTKTVEEQRVWYDHHGDKYPILVAEEDKKVTGWSSMSAYSDRCAYAATAEASVYIREGQRGKGLGRQLSEAILKAGKDAGLHTVILRIAEGNEASLKLAKSLGFKDVGTMKEVGKKFGKLLDVYIMQLIYD
jgi:L-amino acid N-acyltransferase YncA